jgi:hemin uptake protein HemP
LNTDEETAMLDAQPSPMPLNRSDIVNTSSSLGAPRQVKSGTLFDGSQELRIDHNGQEYRLRQTRNGKLILTK